MTVVVITNSRSVNNCATRRRRIMVVVTRTKKCSNSNGHNKNDVTVSTDVMNVIR